MEIFKKVFEWLANLSSKLPEIDLKTYFIVVVAVVAGIGVIIGLTFFGSRAFKLKKACKKIVKYLSHVDAIDDDNLADFVNQCFSVKAPQSLRDSWVEYLNVRFGFPSEIVSQQNVLDKEIKKVKDVRANIFVGIALILVALFAFWGFGTLDAISMSVIHCLGLLIAGVGYLVLVILNRSQIKKTSEAFALMQEELDVKVYLQVEKNYATDSSPLNELAAMVDEIVARNTSKIVEITDELNQEDLTTLEEGEHTTPIESLIAFEELDDTQQAEQVVEDSEVVEDEPKQEQTESEQEPEAVEQDEQIVEDEPVVEEEVVEDEIAQEEPQEEIYAEQVEEAVEELTQEVQEDSVEESQEEIEESQQDEDEVVEEEPTQDQQIEEVASEDEPVEEEIIEEEIVQETEDVEEATEDTVEETEEIVEDEPEAVEQEESQEEEPDVVYVVDGPEEDELEVVKPAKLVKLPHLVNFITSKDFPDSIKLQFATVLMQVYKKHKNSPEDRKIAKDCLAKYILYLQK